MAFGKDFHLLSTSGGTDICSTCQLFILSNSITGLLNTLLVVVTGTPNLPVYAGGMFTTNLPLL